MATDTFAESQAEPSTVATDNEVLLNKATLLSDNMRSHELRILEGLRRDLNLPLATQPIRMARIPDDTQATILGTPSTVPVSATQLPARSLRAPVTQQHAEDVIGMDIEMDIGVDIAPRRLVENLLHVAEQLFRLADARNHYRDVNEGDIDVRRGSDGIHLVVDYGAVRKGVSPRAHSAKSDASTVVCRASYDMRAANPLFLPTCSDFARPAVQSWDSMSSQSSDFSGVVNDDNAEEALKDIRDDLPMFKGSLRDASVYGIRSIDDLESAVYLHLWQVNQP